jgi:hypothetical protein
MWESLSVALSFAGFLAAVILVIAALPAVFDQSRSWFEQGHR